MVLLLLGAVLGVKCSFFFEYPVSDTKRIVSFPIPTGILRLEGGHWVGYIVDLPWLIALMDVLLFLSVSVLPLSVGYAVRRFVIHNRECSHS